MAPDNRTLVASTTSDVVEHIDPSQTLRASTALLRKIQSQLTTKVASSAKTDLLADADDENEEQDAPVWLILTTKKHISDKHRLKPGKIVLPNPYIDRADPKLRICLITADPQRRYKDLIAHPSFPLELSTRIGRVIGLSKLKAKYKTFETRRQLLSEFDVFLADDRIITSLPHLLGKIFYKSGSKRPVPIDIQGKRQNFDEQGNKRRKLSEGGTKVVRDEVKPTDVAHEINRALSSALVHLAPSTTTAVKVGKATMEPHQLQQNIETVIAHMVEKYVPRKWPNVRSIHIKGPETIALPIWLASELWEDEGDVLEEGLPAKDLIRGKRRAVVPSTAAPAPEVIEIPGPDGKMRQIEKPSGTQELAKGAKGDSRGKKRKLQNATENSSEDAERAGKAARKAALQHQKAAAKAAANGLADVGKNHDAENPDGTKGARRSKKKVSL